MLATLASPLYSAHGGNESFTYWRGCCPWSGLQGRSQVSRRRWRQLWVGRKRAFGSTSLSGAGDGQPTRPSLTFSLEIMCERQSTCHSKYRWPSAWGPISDRVSQLRQPTLHRRILLAGPVYVHVVAQPLSSPALRVPRARHRPGLSAAGCPRCRAVVCTTLAAMPGSVQVTRTTGQLSCATPRRVRPTSGHA